VLQQALDKLVLHPYKSTKALKEKRHRTRAFMRKSEGHFFPRGGYLVLVPTGKKLAKIQHTETLF
jgi:hypothetical protein